MFLPTTRRFEYVKEFKQAHRRDDDIAIVNAGMRVSFKESEGDIDSLTVSIDVRPHIHAAVYYK